MGQGTRPVFVLDDFSGGLNTAEPPDQIGHNQLADSRNVEYRRSRGLVRRRGSVLNITGTPPYTGSIVSLFRHTPGQNETSMELWGVDNATPPIVARLAAGTAWSAALTVGDAISNNPDFLKGVSFNGKLFLPYNSAVDRLHLWDGTRIRRVGLATPSAPSVANTGSGTYPAVTRYYKVLWAFTDANNHVVCSPLSSATSFTPSGSGTAARISRPTLAGEAEGAWWIFGSPDGVNYYKIATLTTATTSYDDTRDPADYPDVFPADAGFPTQADYFTAPISAKFLLVDGAQLLLGGSWETTGLSSTVFYTDALGTSATWGLADDERIPSTNRIDIDPQHGGGLTGMGGPIGGTPVVFKEERTYLLIPTGDATLPYRVRLLSDVVGCINHHGIVMAEDEYGAPALYWPSRRGIYRYGANGLEYCSRDIEDLWATVNFAATNKVHGVYHREAGQIWWWVPVGSNNTPTVRLKFHVERGRRTEMGVRGGWTRDNGTGATATASCMFADTLGATMSRRLKPYLAKTGTQNVYKADADGVNQDDNDDSPFTAYAVTRAVQHPLNAALGEQFGVQGVLLQGVAEGSAVTLDVALRRNFAATDTVSGTVTLATTRGLAQVPGLEVSECDTVQVRVSDQSAADQHWSVDKIGLRVRSEAPVP